jgi:cytoskeletal protein RodZ
MEENGRKRKKRSAILTAIVLLFLLACLLFIWWAKHVSRPADTAHEALGTEEMLSDSSTQAVEKRRDGVGDSTAVVDSGDVAVVDSSGEQSTEREGSEVATPLEPSFVDSGADDADTVGMVASVDSAAQVAPDAADTGTIAAIFGSDEGAGGCYGDTLAPWVYPDPSGGLHRGSVEVEFVANEPCSVFWRSEGEDEWRYHRGAPLSIDSTATIEYTATDTCGNRMDTKAEYYEVKRSKPSGRCPERMALVEIGSTDRKSVV